jgi:hypothetical protein
MFGALTATGIDSHYPALAHKACSGIEKVCGAVAQLGERRVRNAKVRGSIPLGSTTLGVAARVIILLATVPVTPSAREASGSHPLLTE